MVDANGGSETAESSSSRLHQELLESRATSFARRIAI